jgi:putative ABC transport system permease protein
MPVLSHLDRKLLRDSWRLRGQMIAIALVVMCGVSQFVINRMSYDALRNTQSRYYAESRFANVFVGVKRAPDEIANRIAALTDVQAVESRVVMDIILDVPGLDEPATGRVVSIPEDRQPDLNRLYLPDGRYIEQGKTDEILVSEAFAEANQLRPGSSIGAAINGRWRNLQVVGIALSPEYIYEIQPGGFFPNNKRFGVLWMGGHAVRAAFNMEGAFNDLALTLAHGASESHVITQVDEILRPYGGLGAYGRGDQVSNRFLSDEISQNRVSGMVIPSIFLAVSAFLTSTVLKRLVTTQRDQIAVLKAFGFSNASIATHYAKFGILIVVAGTLAGSAVGVWMSGYIAHLYSHFYRFPILDYHIQVGTIALVAAVSLATAVASSVFAAWSAATLPPAEAMRPEAPANFRRGFLEYLGITRLIPISGRIVLRNLTRQPVKAIFSASGIAMGVAILLLGRYFYDAIIYMGDMQFRQIQLGDATVVFNNPRPISATWEIARLPGVLNSEPYRTVAVRLRNGYRARRLGIMGLARGSELHRLIAKDLNEIPIPETGVVLTAKLAEILNTKPGEQLEAEVLEGKRGTHAVLVAGVVDELLGLSAYMNINELNALMDEAPSVSGTLVRLDQSNADGFYSSLKRMPVIASASSKQAAIESFEETLAQNFAVSTGVLILFATIIAFAAVYNSGRIALSERARELASLRVLGFTRAEVATMVVGEQGILVAAALPVGLLAGYTSAAMISRIYSWELFRIPLVITASSYAFSLVVVGAAAVLSGWIVRRRVHRMNLVSTIKTRE